jgi:hypothetical protein
MVTSILKEPDFWCAQRRTPLRTPKIGISSNFCKVLIIEKQKEKNP